MKLPRTIDFIKGLQNDIREKAYASYEDAQAQNILSEHYCAEIIKVLEEQEKHRWIPISERLPEEGEKVLITYTEDGESQIMVSEYFEHFFGGSISFGMKWSLPQYYHQNCVTAWMPMIEPYKEVKNNE